MANFMLTNIQYSKTESSSPATTTDDPRLGVLIINWNTREWLRKALLALRSSTMAAQTAVLVVDNASTDGSVAMVHAEFPELKTHTNLANLGYAGAVNMGLRKINTPYILIMNTDVLIPTDALSALLDFMDQHPRAGACSPKLQGVDGTAQPYAFGGDPSPLYMLRRGLKRCLLNRALHDWDLRAVQSVDWVSGACLLVRRAAIAQAGPMDESFFMYFEDCDWCRRIRSCGWQVYYVPTVAVTHAVGQSLAGNPAARDAYRQSLRHYYDKHYGALGRAWLRIARPIYERLQQ